MIDRVRVTVQAGRGGDGCESYFRRTDKKLVHHGGYGGNGGSIIFRTSQEAPPIAHFCNRRHIIAESGGHGGSNRKRGKNGEDIIYQVPLGTRLVDLEKNFMIREMVEEDEEVVVVQGGRGGKGNQGGGDATQGEPGQIIDLEISIRLFVDVVMIGLPNSGKSSILNQLTRTHLKAEEYPFSTRDIERGVWNHSDYEHLTLCEMPSLHASSHEGKGLGNRFLKHLERARYLLFVVDPVSEFSESVEQGVEVLKDQLVQVDKKFLDIPSAVLVNKMDLPLAQEAKAEQQWNFNIPTFEISAKEGEGFDELKKLFETLLESV